MHENCLTYASLNNLVLRASGLLLPLMRRTAPVTGIGIKALSGRYHMVNPAMEALLGKAQERILDLTDEDIFPSDIAERLKSSEQSVLEGSPAAIDEFVLHHDGCSERVFWQTLPLVDERGQARYLCVIAMASSADENGGEKAETLASLMKANAGLRRSVAELNELSGIDRLTGAWNRRRLEESVASEMDRLRRYDHPLSLLLVDIDFFKAVNDRYGHLAGDKVLAQTANRIQAALRTTDSLTRWGGEEFVILCPDTVLSTATILAERLLKIVETTEFQIPETITVSIGVAECLKTETWEEWFSRVDAALYFAKTQGRNQVVTADLPLETRAGQASDIRNPVRLIWHPGFECGHPRIDDQHQSLFAHANALLSALLSNRSGEEVGTLIDTLFHDIVAHFVEEEGIIASVGYPGAQDHAEIHRNLVEKAEALMGHYRSGTLAVGDLFQYLAYDVVARHMLGADREFFRYLEIGQAKQ